LGIGNAIIGALRVNLGLDSAAFTAGLKLAQGEVGQFSRIAKTGLIGLSTAALGVAAALAFATKGAINHADAMSKMAQKAGVTTESLSRLAYAASFSDVQTEELTSSLGKLSKSMADAAANATGQTASAFAALGISVVDSSGKLRSADAVFSDLSDRFSRIEDGSTKTAIAMSLLGKSGADLIPLLNGGATELKRFADESDRTGNTISTKTGKAAEQFNDTMATIGTTLAGIANKLAEALLPDLQKLAGSLVGMNPEVLKWGGLLTAGLVALGPLAAGIGLATPVIGGMTAAVVALNTALLALAGTFATPALLAGLALLLSTSPAGAGEDALVKKLGLTKLPQPGSAFTGGFGSGALGAGAQSVGPSTFDFANFLNGSGGGAIDLSKFTDPAGQKVDTLTDKIGKLKEGLAAIGPVAGLAQQAMADGFDTAVGALGNLSGALSSAFKDSKAFAVSTAILQGLQGVAYALGSSAPPWNFINAAAVGIEAAANVASILSTNQNSTSMPSGGGGGASAAAAASQQQQQATNVVLHGDFFSAESVADMLANLLADGGGSRLVNVMTVPR
jgi:hypothetical protein